nr:CZB domain-containing protein [Oceanobacter mangrovi]
MDHVVWKSQVYAFIRTEDKDGANSLADHTSCRLGKWYHQGQGHEMYRQFSAYKRLDKCHRQVHDNGFGAINAALSGKHGESISRLQQMEAASVEVIQVLSELEEEIRNQ